MASEIVVLERDHETIDNNLCKAQAIIRLASDRNAEPQSRANALWAADDLLEEVRAKLGRY